jgi:WhiB family redox-sensing transcriptional regulator
MQETVVTPSTQWREQAACLEHPAVLFFGLDENETPAERRIREEEAKRICLTCGVRDDCLEYALSTREPYGIWGGLTEVERRSRLHRRSN